VALWDAWQAGDAIEARRLNYRLWPLFRALFVETNPIPVKAGLHLQGHYQPDIRLPMTSATDATVAAIRKVLADPELL